jgi:uncharacterized protein (DUF58 family)
VLADDTIALARAAIAEARRFPNLASKVHRINRERGTAQFGQTFAALSKSDAQRFPAFAPERVSETAQRFTDVVFLPFIMRALFGEDLAQLRSDVDRHAHDAVAFFLAACGQRVDWALPESDEKRKPV